MAYLYSITAVKGKGMDLFVASRELEGPKFQYVLGTDWVQTVHFGSINKQV